ncbi:MAG: 4Fe-4S binding protein [bacterium]|nr:4Fe-4S binding protein [bacterium]
MIRKIIRIDEKKCNGCGLCAAACHEGAIEIIDGKAKLVREHFCDGLGDCLPSCPQNAISFEEREAPAYDKQAVKKSQEKLQPSPATGVPHKRPSFINMEENNMEDNHNNRRECGCPGSKAMKLDVRENGPAPASQERKGVSRLAQWPCQIKLVPIEAPFYENAKLLIAADCSAYAYAGMHEELMEGRITLIGCPKLDSEDYSIKLAEIIKRNSIKSVTVVRMEVPCCGGLEAAVQEALQKSGKFLPWQVITISRDGRILEQS